ncbi:MAG: hypothetical protein V1875_08150 [Candidatus Altiarchaeota archaeon]
MKDEEASRLDLFISKRNFSDLTKIEDIVKKLSNEVDKSLKSSMRPIGALPLGRKGKALFTDVKRRLGIFKDWIDIDQNNILEGKNFESIYIFDDSIRRGKSARDNIRLVQKICKRIYFFSLVAKEDSFKVLKNEFPEVNFSIQIFTKDNSEHEKFYREIMFPYFDYLGQPMDNDHFEITLYLAKNVSLDDIAKGFKEFPNRKIISYPRILSTEEKFKVSIEFNPKKNKWNKKIGDVLDFIEIRGYIDNSQKEMILTPIVGGKFPNVVCDQTQCELKNQDWICLREHITNKIKEENENAICRDCIIYNIPLDQIIEVIKKIGIENIYNFDFECTAWKGCYGDKILNPIKEKIIKGKIIKEIP